MGTCWYLCEKNIDKLSKGDIYELYVWAVGTMCVCAIFESEA